MPVTLVPIGISNSSPNATLTAGAVCTTTYLSSFLSAFHTSDVPSFSFNAPTGHASIHCPQNVQSTSFRLWSYVVDMHDSNPLSIQSIAPISCTFLHVAIHLLHSMHLLKSML